MGGVTGLAIRWTLTFNGENVVISWTNALFAKKINLLDREARSRL